MLKAFLNSPSPLELQKGVALIRVLLGLLLLYHGMEIFDSSLMREYMKWEVFRGPAAGALVYGGKGSELLAGILMLLGFCTRLAALLTLITFSFITFFVGEGRFWYEDQHPFLFALFGLLFLFTGPGAWSLDSLAGRDRHRIASSDD